MGGRGFYPSSQISLTQILSLSTMVFRLYRDPSWFRHARTTPSIVKLTSKIALMARPFDRKLRGPWIQRLPSERPVSSPQELQPDPDHHQTPLEVVPFRSWPGWFVGNSFPCRPGLQVRLSQGLDSVDQISSSPRFVEELYHISFNFLGLDMRHFEE